MSFFDDIVNNPIILIISLSTALFLGIMMYVVYYFWQKNVNSNSLSQQIDEVILYEYQEMVGEEESKSSGWSYYWGNLFKNAGFSRYAESNTRAGIEVAAGSLFISLLSAIILQSVIVFVAFEILILVCLSLFLKKIADKDKYKLNSQLPGFLFALKANLGTKSPSEAITSIADVMPEPLRGELAQTRSLLLSGQTFEQAIDELIKTTTSRELEELGRYMLIASRKGTSLTESIDTIQGILVSKQEIEDEKRRAIASTRLDFYVSLFAIPVAFVATYVLSEDAREFWFGDLLSWAILSAVVLFYVAGVFFSRRAVRVLDDRQR